MGTSTALHVDKMNDIQYRLIQQLPVKPPKLDCKVGPR